MGPLSEFPVFPVSIPGTRLSRFPVHCCLHSRYGWIAGHMSVQLAGMPACLHARKPVIPPEGPRANSRDSRLDRLPSGNEALLQNRELT